MQNHRWCTETLLVAVTFLGIASCSQSPNPRFAEYEACKTCKINVDAVLRFQDSDVFPIDVPIIVATGHDSYYVVTLRARDVIARYDSRGRFIGQSQGRGQGPGELVAIRAVEPTSEGLVVLDGRNRRRLRTTADLQPLSDQSLSFSPRPQGYARLNNGTEAVIALQVDGILQPPPIHILDSVGSIQTSLNWPYGYPGRLLDLEITPASDSTFWAFNPRTAHAIEFTVNGAITRRLEPPTWFEVGDYEDIAGGQTASPIHDTLLSMLPGTSGVWMLFMTPAPDWDGTGRRRVEEIAKMTDTVLQLVDPASGTILASTVLDEFGDRLLPGERLVVVGVDRGGVPLIEIYAFERASAR